MKNPKVSVVVPVYNVEKYLEECLDSLINQTLSEIEIICIDDGSTDRCPEILKNYADKDDRIKIITKQNEGQGIARNIGVKSAVGEYLIFVDSDDWLELNALELLYNKIKNDNADIIFFNVYNYYEESGAKDKYYYVSPYFQKYKDNPFEILDAKDIIFQTNTLPFKMYKAETWMNHDVEFSSHRFLEDALPYFKFLTNAKTATVLTNYIYNYRRHEKSARSNAFKYTRDVFDVFYECEKIVFDSPNGIHFADSFLENRFSSVKYWFEKANKDNKVEYYPQMRKFCIHVLSQYQAVCSNGSIREHYTHRAKRAKSYMLFDVHSKLIKTLCILRAKFI